MSLLKFQAKIGASQTGVFDVSTFKLGRDYLKLNNIQAAHFFGQTSHETASFTKFEENLNYSAEGLLKQFPKYFSVSNVIDYARKPEKIANRVYANRMGNGDEKSGDGWMYRGRGAIQLTGKSNYISFAEKFPQLYIVFQPNLVATDYAFESAKYYFDSHGIWAICVDVSISTITNITKIINGGDNGLQDRIDKTKQYYGWV